MATRSLGQKPRLLERVAKVPSAKNAPSQLASKEEMADLEKALGTHLDADISKPPWRASSFEQQKSQPTAQQVSRSFMDIAFPPLRSVLWDRTPLDESCVLGPEAHVPEMVFRRAALASLFHTAAEATGYFSKMESFERDERNVKLEQMFVENNDQLAVLIGTAMEGSDFSDFGEWVGGAWRLCIDRLYKDGRAASNVSRGLGEELALKTTWTIPSKELIESAKQSSESGGYEQPFADHSPQLMTEKELGFSEQEYKTIIRNVVDKFRVRGPASPMQYLGGYAKCLALPGDRLLFRAEVILPALTLEFTPVTPLSILYTPLACQLEKWASVSSKDGVDSSDPTACGYLTLNQTRKVVFLLEDDPLAYDIPLVGVWIRGSTLRSSREGLKKEQVASSWQSMLNDPLLWSVCLRYIHNEEIKEKVSPPNATTTFLVVVYPWDSPLPTFVECKYSMYQSREYLDQVGIRPRPFLQLESCFTVDVGARNTKLFPGGNGHVPDAVHTKFFHVEDLQRRKNFQAALENIIDVVESGKRDQVKLAHSEEEGKLNHHGIDSMYFRHADESYLELSSVGQEHLFNAPSYEEGANKKTTHSPVPTPLSYAEGHVVVNGRQNKLSQIYHVAPPGVSTHTFVGEDRSLIAESSRELDSRFPEQSAFTFSTETTTQANSSRSATKSTPRRKKRSQEKDFLVNMISAQQQQISLLQKQLNGLQKLMEDQIRLSLPPTPDYGVKGAIVSAASNAVSGSSLESASEKNHPSAQKLVDALPTVNRRGSDDGRSRLYVANLALYDEEEDSTVYPAPLEEQTCTGGSKGLQVSVPETPSKHSRGVEEDSSSVSEVQDSDSEGRIVSESARKSGVLQKPEMTSAVEISSLSRHQDHTSTTTESGDLVRINEMETEFGIPKINSQRKSRERYLDDDDGNDEDEEENWLAAVEAKYLDQLRRPSS